MANRKLWQIENSGVRSFDDLKQFFQLKLPRFEFVKSDPFMVEFGWRADIAEAIEAINPRRTEKRIASYLIDEEMTRVSEKLQTKDSASIRFGVLKTGKGIKGERGDFCMVGGVLSKGGRKLNLFYRSLELIGGLHYDMTLINDIVKRLDIRLEMVEVWAIEAHTMALKGNSNEKLHARLTRIYKELP